MMYFTENGSYYFCFEDGTTFRTKKYEDGSYKPQVRSTVTVYLSHHSYLDLQDQVRDNKWNQVQASNDIVKLEVSLVAAVNLLPFELFIPDRTPNSKSPNIWKIANSTLIVRGLATTWKNGQHFHIGHKITKIEK